MNRLGLAVLLQLLLVRCSCAMPIAPDDLVNYAAGNDHVMLLQRQAQKQTLTAETPGTPGHSSSKQCITATECNIVMSKVVRSELETGGELRFADVCKISSTGQVLDLAVTTSSNYKAKKAHMNGMYGVYGNINLNAGDSWDFTFTFYEAGTHKEVKVKSFYFSFFDMDGWWTQKGGMRQYEQITLQGYEYFTVAPNCELKRNITGTSAQFTSTTGGGVGDNPADPMKLTPLQASRSVTFVYTDVSSFKANFAIRGPSKWGTRNILFAGESSINKDCSWPVCRPGGVCKMKFDTLKHSNLGGSGPDGGAQELRFGSVCSIGKTDLDLVVTADAQYDAANTKNNGIHGQYGQVNVRQGKKTNLLFSFKKKDTQTPVMLDFTSFTIFDIDSGANLKKDREILEASQYMSYTIDNKTELIVEHPTANSLRLTSTTFGVGADNPTDPMNLTPQQAARSVTFNYKSVKQFPLFFENTGGNPKYGRNLLFAGDSSLNKMCSSSP